MSLKIKIENITEEFLKLNKQREIELRNKTKETVDTMVKELVPATPIDTGKARRSWKTTETPIGINVENTVEYIEKLNQGTSKQAPAHFIESIALKYGTPIGTIVEVKGN